MGVDTIQSKTIKKALLLVGVAYVSACTHTAGQYSYGAPAHGAHHFGAPAQGGVSAPQAYPGVAPAVGPDMATQSNITRLFTSLDQLNERVERTERALIRIDRRLQLIESKELGRMMGQTSDGDIGVQPSFYPTQQGAAPSLPGGQKAPRFQPVANAHGLSQPTHPYASSAPNGFMGLNSVLNAPMPQGASRNPSSAPQFMPVSSSLQAAPPRMVPMSAQSTASGGLGHVGAMKRMPSLADAAPTSLGVADKTDVSIWTVAFEPAKVWPGRDQLPQSRMLVEKLKLNQPIALYARGKNPNSKAFRERVRALSRYLSKVSDRSDISISTLTASHLGDETIEIFATR